MESHINMKCYYRLRVVASMYRYSYKWDDENKKYLFTEHFKDMYVKQSMNPKDEWREVDIVTVLSNFFISYMLRQPKRKRG